MKKVLIIYGPPGSGKSTQAELLERKLGFFHFNTGQYIEGVVHNPANKNNSEIKKQKKLFDSGILCEPAWVLKIIKEEAERVAKADWDLVFSGSPRTLFEAFGDSKNIGLLALLEKYYKKEIYFINLNVRESVSLHRNSNRLMCSVCGLPILSVCAGNEHCSFCMGKVYKRTLDKPEIIKVRLEEYKKRTYPIFETAKKKKYKVFNINGELAPYKVYEEIVKKIVV